MNTYGPLIAGLVQGISGALNEGSAGLLPGFVQGVQGVRGVQGVQGVLNDNIHRRGRVNASRRISSAPTSSYPEFVEGEILFDVAPFRIVKDRLEKQTCDVIAYAAPFSMNLNATPLSKLLLKEAGHELQISCNRAKQNGVFADDIISTEGYNLKSKLVFHMMIEKNASSRGYSYISKMIRKCFERAKAENAKSIAIPIIGSGKLGYSMEESLKAIKDEGLKLIKQCQECSCYPLTITVVIFGGDPQYNAIKRTLRQLSLHAVGLNYKETHQYIKNLDTTLPVSISEEVIQSIDSINRGVTDNDLLDLGRLKLQLTEFKINGAKIKDLKSLCFLKTYPIQKLDLKHLTVLKSLDDLERIVNVGNLRELSISFLGNSLKISRSKCKHLKSLTKLYLNRTNIKNHDFMILCEELSNLEELTVKEFTNLSIHRILKLKKLKSLKFADTMNDTETFNVLRQLKHLKEIQLDCYSRVKMENLEKCFFNSDWQLEKLVAQVGRWDENWLKKIYNRNLKIEKPELKFCHLSTLDDCFVYNGKNTYIWQRMVNPSFNGTGDSNDLNLLLDVAHNLKEDKTFFIIYKLNYIFDNRNDFNLTEQDLNTIWKIIFEMIDNQKYARNVKISTDFYLLEYIKLINRMLDKSNDEYYWIKSMNFFIELFDWCQFHTRNANFYCEISKTLIEKWKLSDKVISKHKMFKLLIKFFYEICAEYNIEIVAKRENLRCEAREVGLEDAINMLSICLEKMSVNTILQKLSIREAVIEIVDICKMLYQSNKPMELSPLKESFKAILGYYRSCLRDFMINRLNIIPCDESENLISIIRKYQEQILNCLHKRKTCEDT
ncbi:DgyrCDS3853 [Dimorphilus gyrociliatus]|uniref:DgyrCDS3853 n=1 Tax=Dimorphilus gyrociliatus TaxID=2664684 RepID=A0A7I8VFP7_9ANNE|nr:DgyrCDS3853 [Dimorphilus gyrociliatus]